MDVPFSPADEKGKIPAELEAARSFSPTGDPLAVCSLAHLNKNHKMFRQRFVSSKITIIKKMDRIFTYFLTNAMLQLSITSIAFIEFIESICKAPNFNFIG